MIHCDAVHWKRMATFVEGAAGHLFSLTHQGECVCRIEVEAVVGDSVGKIAVVQPSYSALSVAANVAPPSSLLVFDDLRAHIDSLKRLRPAPRGERRYWIRADVGAGVHGRARRSRALHGAQLRAY